jgi:superoxide dismutase, Cu-Zn family
MKRVSALGSLVFLMVVVYALSGCARHAEQAAPITKAIAVLSPTQGSKVQGVVSFSKERDGVRVEASIQGLTPGLHGFHLHEYGDCSSPDANSAGGHFNPGDMPHGGPTAEKHHAGDLGNLQADASGNAKLTLVSPKMAFEGPGSIVGRGVIVHAQPDDFTTQPTGASGPRVACGVVGIVK